MSMHQSHHSSFPQSSQQDEEQQSHSPNVVKYDSIQGALGVRRVSLPVAYPRHNLDNSPPMSSERYAYPHSTAPSSSSHASHQNQYPYEPQYSSSSSPYETPHYIHNSLPRMRTPQSLSEPPRQTPSGHAQSSSYSLGYMSYPQPPLPPSQSYAVPSGLPASSWDATYAQYPGSPSDSSLSPELVRNETLAAPPSQPPPPHAAYRGPEPVYSSGSVPPVRQYSSSDVSRDPGSLDSKGKQKEAPQPPPPPLTPFERSQQPPDFPKIVQTYRSLLDNASHASSPSTAPGVLNRIYEYALEGVRQFSQSEPSSSPPRSDSPISRSHPSKDDNNISNVRGSSTKRPRTDSAPGEPQQKCMGCGATSTPEWRRGPKGPRTLCNACGLVYAKLIKKRGRDAAGRSIMQGINYATAAVAGNVPGDYTPDYPLASGNTGTAPPHQLQHQQHPRGDDVREAVPQQQFSSRAGSEDGSYDSLQRHSGHGPSRGPALD